MPKKIDKAIKVVLETTIFLSRLFGAKTSVTAKNDSVGSVI
jgi:hypothetical protein